MNQQTNTSNNKSDKGFMGWLADHPTIKVIAAFVAIVGGMIGIVTFITGQTSLTGVLAWLSNSYYDRFNSRMYEGSYDKNRWRLDGNPGVLVEQRDGALIIQPVHVTESSNLAILPIQKSPIPFEEFDAVEAKLMMGSNASGTGFIKTQAFTIQNEKNWWIECKLESVIPGQLYFACNVETGKYDEGGTPTYTYETEKIPASYDTWYLARFEVDHQKNQIRFYLNHRLIGEYTLENGMYFASLSPQFGSWVEIENDFIGYYDDIRIETSRKSP
jgi:hypothetical protein